MERYDLALSEGKWIIIWVKGQGVDIQNILAIKLRIEEEGRHHRKCCKVVERALRVWTILGKPFCNTVDGTPRM